MRLGSLEYLQLFHRVLHYLRVQNVELGQVEVVLVLCQKFEGVLLIVLAATQPNAAVATGDRGFLHEEMAESKVVIQLLRCILLGPLVRDPLLGGHGVECLWCHHAVPSLYLPFLKLLINVAQLHRLRDWAALELVGGVSVPFPPSKRAPVVEFESLYVKGARSFCLERFLSRRHKISLIRVHHHFVCHIIPVVFLGGPSEIFCLHFNLARSIDNRLPMELLLRVADWHEMELLRRQGMVNILAICTIISHRNFPSFVHNLIIFPL